MKLCLITISNSPASFAPSTTLLLILENHSSQTFLLVLKKITLGRGAGGKTPNAVPLEAL